MIASPALSTGHPRLASRPMRTQALTFLIFASLLATPGQL